MFVGESDLVSGYYLIRKLSRVTGLYGLVCSGYWFDREVEVPQGRPSLQVGRGT